MYPSIEFLWATIYTFWICVTVCYFMFAWMLYRMSKRLDYDFSIFKDNILIFSISVLFFSRLFYILANFNKWNWLWNIKYFLAPTDYSFLLMWAIFWFFLVLFFILKKRKESLDKYIYWIALSFTFILPLWFIWGLLGGQIYGMDTNFWIEFAYGTIPYAWPVFPLAIVYAILFFLLFSGLYIANMYIKEKNILWYLWFMIFACLIFIFDFLNWKADSFKTLFYDLTKDWSINFLNFSQICALVIIYFWAERIYKFYKKETKRWLK